MIGRVRAAIVRHRTLLIALGVAGTLYCAAIETWLPRIDPPPSAAPQLVIALGAGIKDDGTFNRTGNERLLRALTLARADDVPLVTTYSRHKKLPSITSDGAQRRIIDSAGYHRRWIQLPGLAMTTRQEAERLRAVIQPTRITLVTSRLHTRRACRTFEKFGYQVTCTSSGLDAAWWKIPYSVAYESAAWIKYKVKGWI